MWTQEGYFFEKLFCEMRRVSEGETQDLEAYPCAVENELVERMKLEIERRKIVEQGIGGAGYYILSTSAEITLELNKGLGYH